MNESDWMKSGERVILLDIRERLSQHVKMYNRLADNDIHPVREQCTVIAAESALRVNAIDKALALADRADEMARLLAECRDYLKELATDIGNDSSVGVSNAAEIDLMERCQIALGELIQCPYCPKTESCNFCYDAGRLTPEQYADRNAARKVVK